MKKIIYSLVIMIAAGSLFTSCIEPVEPAGLLDLRTAKAEYIRALKDLRAADAELQRALAAVEQANARYRDAETAYKNAETDSLKRIAELQAKYQELVNEAKAIENDMLREDFKVKQQQVLAEIEAIKQQMENNQKQHEIDLVGYQQQLAQAQENLRVALRNIALASKELTSSEQNMLNTLVAAYEQAVQDVMDQQVTVLEKKQEYDAAVAKLDSVDLAWDHEDHEFVEIQEIWQKNIDNAKAAQEVYATALENVPEQPQLEEWDAYLKEYAEDSIAWAMKRWENTKDSAELMVTVHDAATAYAAKWDKYISDNDLEESLDDARLAGQLKYDSYYGTVYTQITPEEPEYDGGTSYWPINIVRILNEDGTDYDYYGPGLTPPDGKEMAGTDTVADIVTTFPKLKGRTSAAYDKFNAVIADYTTAADYDYYDIDGNPQTQAGVELVTKTGDNYGVNASLDMKDFLLATAETNIDGAKLVRQDADGNDFTAAVADYGLKGAVDILKRWKVLVDKEGTAWADSLKTVKKAWEQDRETLTVVFNYGVKKGSDGKTTWQKVKDTATPKKEAKALEADNTKLGFGLTVPANMSYLYTFPTYKNALDAIPEAKAAYDDAVADSVATMKTIKEKMQAYINAFNNWDGTTFNGNDSSNVWSAMTEYMLARAAALKMPDQTSAKAWYTKNFGPKQNPLYYYFASRSDVTPAEVDSILWTDLAKLSYKDFRKKEDRGAYGKDTKYAFYAKEGDANDGKVPAYVTKENAVFVMVAYQLFNSDFFNAMVAKVTLPDTTAATFTASDNRTLFGPTAFGGSTLKPYTAVLDGATIVVKSTDDIKDRADLCVTTTPKATYKAKAQKVQAAINKYKEIYNNYWGFTAFPGESEKRDPQCYELKTFNEPYPIAVYTGDVPEPTTGLQVVLASVDPLADPADAKGTNFDPVMGNSQIFGTEKKSDFCLYMEATWKSANEESASLEQDIKDIEAWVNDVEAYFASYAEHEAGIAKKVFEADYATYERQEAYAEFWYGAYAELVGGEITNPYGEKCIYRPMKRDLTLGANYASNFVNPKTGKWTVYGKQLEWAKECFGEDFAAKYGELYATEQEIADEIAHNNIILNAMKPAYVAAAKIAQYNTLLVVDEDGKFQDTTFYTGDDFYELMAWYQITRENYVNELNREIANQEQIIDDNMYAMATYTSGVAAQEYVVAQKARDLAKAEARLEMLMDKLDKLQEAIDSLVAYLEGTGAEFILPGIEGIGTAHRGTTEIVGPDFNFGGNVGGSNAGIGGVTLDQLVAWIQGLFNGGDEVID